MGAFDCCYIRQPGPAAQACRVRGDHTVEVASFRGLTRFCRSRKASFAEGILVQQTILALVEERQGQTGCDRYNHHQGVYGQNRSSGFLIPSDAVNDLGVGLRGVSSSISSRFPERFPREIESSMTNRSRVFENHGLSNPGSFRSPATDRQPVFWTSVPTKPGRQWRIADLSPLPDDRQHPNFARAIRQ